MSNFPSYKTKAFSPSQKFFVLDPNTGSPSFVQGSDLVDQITPNSNYVYSESTRTTAQATDYAVGALVQTAGSTTAGDNFAAVYLVVAAGEGDFPMDNGNELLVIAGDELLREQLASFDAGDGSDLVAHTGTTETVTEALNQRTIYVGSVAELETTDLLVGTSVYLTQEGRHGPGIIKSGTPPTDTKKGIYIPTMGGKYWVRQHGQAVTTGAVLKPEWFGLVKDDETVSVAEENYSVLRECIRFSFKHYIPLGVAEYAPTEIELPSGKIFVKGNSPLCLNRTDMVELGGNRYLRGLSWRGKGRKATRLILMNDGAETWLYDTVDASFPGDTSVQDYTQFFHIGFESYDYYKNDRKYRVADASKINGFYMETYGFEKRFTWEGCSFEGFDKLYQWEGFGNGDLNTWTGCRAAGIIDTVFYCNNNQSVVNRLYGFDISTYGDAFYIGPNGGGDFKFYGGSIIQYPIHDVDNLPDSTLSAATPRAFYHLNLGTISGGATSAIPTGSFIFHGLRFENYDKYNHTVISERDDDVNYGQAIAHFHECTFDIEREFADDATSSSPATGNRDLVVATRQNSDILFEDCTFRERQYFNLSEYKASASTTMSLRFRDCRLVDHDETENFYDRIVATNGDASLCTVSVDARKMKTGRPFLGTKRRAAHDFTIRNSNVEGAVVDKYQSNIKDKDASWPDSLTSENRLYLPPGSMFTSVTVKKDAVAPAGGVANYRLRIYDDSASTVLWQTADFQEEDALYATYELATPHIIPDAPNNHIRLAGLNGTVDKGIGGAVIVGYFTP